MASTNNQTGRRAAPKTTTRQAATTRGQKAAATRKRNATRRSATATRASASRTATSAKTTAETAASATRAESKVRVNQVQQIAERAVLVPVGASLMARDNLVSTVKGLAGKYGNRTSVERELQRYERRGSTARNRLERQVHHTRTRVERELRQRRNRVEKLVSNTQDRLGTI